MERGLGKTPGVEPLAKGWGFRVSVGPGRVRPGAAAGHGRNAVPGQAPRLRGDALRPELEDVYHYGIQGPVKAAGLLCERVDQAVFEGAIIQRIKERIDTAKVVIADLSMANPNVYLEVGYAWGRGRHTILLVRDIKELKFDVAGLPLPHLQEHPRPGDAALARAAAPRLRAPGGPTSARGPSGGRAGRGAPAGAGICSAAVGRG